MYIVDFKRTPIGKFMGSLSGISAPELTNPLFEFFLNKYPFLVSGTNEVVIGNVNSAGIGMNPARIASYNGGMDKSVPAYTVNHACASGMNAIIQGYRAIKSGDADVVLAGGMESMSQTPFLLRGARKGFTYGNQMMLDSLYIDGLYCCLSKALVGEISENLTKKYSITRDEQDQFAFESHKKASKALYNKSFNGDIIKCYGLNCDESVRKNTTIEALAQLKPVFHNKGALTAGNVSPLSDGAALMLLVSENALNKFKLKPKARIIDSVFVGLDPKLMGMGPKYAIKKILKKNNLNIDSIDVFEINEAFAVQVIAVIKELGIVEKDVNINGGAIALGHPLGMSGARIIGSLITSLKQKKKKFGVASLCVGGGQGAAVLIENL